MNAPSGTITTTKDNPMSKEIAIRNKTLLAPQLDYILVDGSFSMQKHWWDTLASLEGFVDVLKSQNINSHGIISVFDSYNLDCVQRDSTLDTWKRFSDDPLGSTWGGTPLYDAINLTGRHLRTLDPPKCSIVIVTDGDEMGSTHTNAVQARAILDWCRAKGWQVTFLGVDFNNKEQARLLGANDENMIGVRKEKLALAGKTLGEKRARNAQSGTDINFTKDEKDNFGGYLTGPSNG